MDEQLKAMSRRREEAHAELLARDSAVYRAFLEQERAAFGDGALPKKVKELIAVGISVVINCESCMQWHIEQAALAGAPEREVLEAIEVGMEMGGGPATAHARFALEVMANVFTAGEA
jgi:AhpD family alkylhydroperoxidase